MQRKKRMSRILEVLSDIETGSRRAEEADINFLDDGSRSFPHTNNHSTRFSSSSSEPVPSRATASRRRRKKKRKGKKKQLIDSTIINYNPHYPAKMKDKSAEIGELAEVGHNFCPYAAVAKFPYKYIDKAHLQPVSEVHFAGGQFRARGWTL